MKRILRLLTLLMALMLPVVHALAFEPLPYEMAAAPYEPHQDCYLPDNGGYHDDSLDIRVETFRRNDTTVMAVYVTIADASQLRTGTCAPNKPMSQSTQTADRIAKRYNAVLAINGDYFTYENSKKGVIVRNGEWLRTNYAWERQTLIIDANGDFSIIPTTEEAFAAFEGEIVHAFWFGPGLVVDGERISDQAIEDLKMNLGKGKKTQRIVLAQMGPLSYLILTCEGPENPGSVGFTIAEMADLCLEMGCINAYNLDGGSSSSVALNYQKINALSSHKNRPVADIIYFCTLVPPEEEGGAT